MARLDFEEMADVIDELRERLDSVYCERNLVIALALKFAHDQGLRTWIDQDKREDIGLHWKNVVYVELPSGKQLSWHVHDSELSQFEFLHKDSKHEWDGHTTEEKYRTIREFCKNNSH